VNAAYISAISALSGSAIGALASLATTWLTQRHQDQARRLAQDHGRRERIFVEFIDLASKAFVDALLQTSIKDPSPLILLYATMGKLRLSASQPTVEAAEKALNRCSKLITSLNLTCRPSRSSTTISTFCASSQNDVAPSSVDQENRS
jgi:hypothetical protein